MRALIRHECPVRQLGIEMLKGDVCDFCGDVWPDKPAVAPRAGTEKDAPTGGNAMIYIVHHNYCSQTLFASRKAADEHAATENAKPVYSREPRYWRVEERELRGSAN